MFSFSYNVNYNGYCNPFMSYNPRLNFFLGMASGFAGLSSPFMPFYTGSVFSNGFGFGMNYPMMYMPMTMPMPITMPITPFMPSISSSTTITQSEGFDKPKKTELNFAAEQQIAADGSEKKDKIKVNKPKVEDKSNYKTNALPKISNSKLMSRVPAQRKAKILDCVNRACKQYNVDPKLVISLMFAESGFDPNATSRCGAAGLMQLMPATAKSYGASNPYDIEQNIFAGTKFLKYLLNRYNGNTDLAVAAYNAGPGRVHNTVPNIKETKNHVAKVNRNMASLA